MSKSKTFARSPESVGVARRFVASSIEDRHSSGESDLAVLLASEIMASAVSGESAPGVMVVKVASRDGRVRVEVTAAGWEGLERSYAGANSLACRQVMILEALAKAWGVVKSGPETTAWFEALA